MNGHWYLGDNFCSAKKEAEKLAAKKALESLVVESISSLTLETSETDFDEPPSYSEAVSADSSYHLPSKYADIEQFLCTKVRAAGGRIQKILPPDSSGRYKFEISGSYRYCGNVQRHHKKNQVYFIVDPAKKTYIQKCSDSDCYGFQSAIKYIDDGQRTNPHAQVNDSRSKCERCGERFSTNSLYECELCHDALHCTRCFDSCFDCHDS